MTAEPINGGHDEESYAKGDFTYDGLAFVNCRLQRDPLIQLTGIGTQPGLSGHFRGVTLANSLSDGGNVVDFGGGPRTNRTDNPVSYFFHDTPSLGAITRVASIRSPATEKDTDYRSLAGWTGSEARAAEVREIEFPQLLKPVDDLPPATLITGIKPTGAKRLISGVAHDNGEIVSVTVNGLPAKITAQHTGVVDWSILLDAPEDGRFVAKAVDRAGNEERLPHVRVERLARP